MAVLKQRLYRKTQDVGYDLVHLETSADVVRMPSGNTVSDVVTSLIADIRTIGINPYVLDTDNIKVGNLVQWSGYEWRVVHKSLTHMYMTTNEIVCTMTYSSSKGYAYSLVAKAVALFEDSLPTAAVKLLDQPNISLSGGTTAKVFIPGNGAFITYSDGSGQGFSYFSSDSRRIAKYNGSPCAYWLSNNASSGSTNDYAGVISANGSYTNYKLEAYRTNGFRPFIAYRL